mgnify:CR=1 FL=1
MPVSDWHDLMRQTVSVAPFSSVDGYGKTSYGAAVTYSARVSGRRRMVRDAEGREVVSSQTVYLLSNTAVSPKVKITLSTGDAGSTEVAALSPEILAVGRFPDGESIHHTEIYLV